MPLPEGSEAWEHLAHNLKQADPQFADFAERVSLGRTTPIPEGAKNQTARMRYEHNVRDAFVSDALASEGKDLAFVNDLIDQTKDPATNRLLRLQRLLILKDNPRIQKVLKTMQNREDKLGAADKIRAIIEEEREIRRTQVEDREE